jgi:hypothetical protein
MVYGAIIGDPQALRPHVYSSTMNSIEDMSDVEKRVGQRQPLRAWLPGVHGERPSICISHFAFRMSTDTESPDSAWGLGTGPLTLVALQALFSHWVDMTGGAVGGGGGGGGTDSKYILIHV